MNSIAKTLVVMLLALVYIIQTIFIVAYKDYMFKCTYEVKTYLEGFDRNKKKYIYKSYIGCDEEDKEQFQYKAVTSKFYGKETTFYYSRENNKLYINEKDMDTFNCLKGSHVAILVTTIVIIFMF